MPCALKIRGAFVVAWADDRVGTMEKIIGGQIVVLRLWRAPIMDVLGLCLNYWVSMSLPDPSIAPSPCVLCKLHILSRHYFAGGCGRKTADGTRTQNSGIRTSLKCTTRRGYTQLFARCASAGAAVAGWPAGHDYASLESRDPVLPLRERLVNICWCSSA